MSRMFSTSVRTLLKWTGFDRASLPEDWRNAVETFTMPGGGAEAVRLSTYMEMTTTLT